MTFSMRILNLGATDANATEIVVLPFSIHIYFDHEKNQYLPLSIPAFIAPELLDVHSKPPAWWIGQILSYLMRPNASMRDRIAQKLFGMQQNTKAVRKCSLMVQNVNHGNFSLIFLLIF